jgi:hypothetical protein
MHHHLRADRMPCKGGLLLSHKPDVEELFACLDDPPGVGFFIHQRLIYTEHGYKSRFFFTAKNAKRAK